MAPKRDKDAGMRSIFALLFAVFLVACAPTGDSHMTDISGAMPALDFNMVRASDGKPVTGKDYRGRTTLLYFGYTNCPDVCPATLSNLALMLEELKGANIAVLFVTVDPARDTLPHPGPICPCLYAADGGPSRHAKPVGGSGAALSRGLFGHTGPAL